MRGTERLLVFSRRCLTTFIAAFLCLLVLSIYIGFFPSRLADYFYTHEEAGIWLTHIMDIVLWGVLLGFILHVIGTIMLLWHMFNNRNK